MLETFIKSMAKCLKVDEFINYYYSTRLGLFVSDLERRYIYNVRDVPILVCEYFEAYKSMKGGYWVRKGRKIVYCRRLGVETIKKLRLKTYNLSLALALLQDMGEYLNCTNKNIMCFDEIDRTRKLYRINRLITV
jgi:hypothetical protein